MGSYPTVSPLPSAVAFRNPLARIAFRPSAGFPADGHRDALHRRFIFCGTVRNRRLASLARTARRASPLALPGALPFGLRRPAAKTFVCAAKREDHGVRTFLPASLLAKVAQRSPGLPASPSISLHRTGLFGGLCRTVSGNGSQCRRPADIFCNRGKSQDCRRDIGATRPATPRRSCAQSQFADFFGRRFFQRV